MILATFDRSILHGDRFNVLKQSSLSRRVAEGAISVVYTSAFVEETLMFARRNPSSFLDQWHFLASLNRTKWFRTPEQILPIELGRKTRKDDYQFLTTTQINKVIQNAPRLAYGNIPQKEINETRYQVARNYDIRDDFRHRRIDLRKKTPVKDYDFDEYFEANVDWFIQDGLMRHHRGSSGFLRNWKEHRKEMGFTEKYLKGWFASLYLPLKDHSLKVDKNDRVDAEQLAFLHWADIFVSDDITFVPRAFDLLYSETDRKLMTSSQFVTFLESI